MEALYIRGQQILSIKGQLVNSLVFVGHMVSVATIQLCFCSIKVAIDNIQMNECSCFNKTLLTLKFAFQIILCVMKYYSYFDFTNHVKL
jgi:hypothetical protein